VRDARPDGDPLPAPRRSSGPAPSDYYNSGSLHCDGFPCVSSAVVFPRLGPVSCTLDPPAFFVTVFSEAGLPTTFSLAFLRSPYGPAPYPDYDFYSYVCLAPQWTPSTGAYTRPPHASPGPTITGRLGVSGASSPGPAPAQSQAWRRQAPLEESEFPLLCNGSTYRG